MQNGIRLAKRGVQLQSRDKSEEDTFTTSFSTPVLMFVVVRRPRQIAEILINVESASSLVVVDVLLMVFTIVVIQISPAITRD